MTKTSDFDAVTKLDDAALETAVGGVKDGCIPGHPIPTWPLPTGPIVFKDPFAIPTLGTYH